MLAPATSCPAIFNEPDEGSSISVRARARVDLPQPDSPTSELLGAETMLYSKVGGTEFISRVDARDFHSPGEVTDLAFNMNKSHFFDMQSQDVIAIP